MTTDLKRCLFVALALFAQTGAGFAQAQAPAPATTPGGPTLIVQSRDWNAFTSQAGTAKTCYAIA
ncbi:hypothetical protein J8J27_29520, partial [Mycobacterium tuberculosis]|nr:hypothetical protein [Mycobacterium tuberculosis]